MGLVEFVFCPSKPGSSSNSACLRVTQVRNTEEIKFYIYTSEHTISPLIDFLPGLYSVQSYINCYMLFEGNRKKKILGKHVVQFFFTNSGSRFECKQKLALTLDITSSLDHSIILDYPEICFKLKIECRMKRNILRKVCGIYERFPDP